MHRIKSNGEGLWPNKQNGWKSFDKMTQAYSETISSSQTYDLLAASPDTLLMSFIFSTRESLGHRFMEIFCLNAMGTSSLITVKRACTLVPNDWRERTLHAGITPCYLLAKCRLHPGVVPTMVPMGILYVRLQSSSPF